MPYRNVTRTRVVSYTVSVPYLENRKVDVDYDPWREFLLREENLGNFVFRFDVVDGRYQTEHGESLTDVMSRCEYDDAFRKRCIVLIPQFEAGVLGQQTIQRYDVYRRPLPGFFVSELPAIALIESFSYRIQWMNFELGQLVSAINLAPGENRAISIERKTKQARTANLTTSAILNIEEKDSHEVAKAIEHEIKQEHSKTKSNNWNVGAKGGFFGFGVSSNLTGSSTIGLKKFARDFTKVTSRAAQSVSRQERQEIQSSVSESSSSDAIDRHTVNIKNVNQASTLNLLFFDVYNRYSAGLYLDDFVLTLKSGRELIQGSGIYEQQQLVFDSFEELLKSFDKAQFPMALSDDQLSQIKENLSQKYRAIIKDYANSSVNVADEEGNIHETREKLEEVNILEGAPDEIANRFKGTTPVSTKIQGSEEDLVISSGALYLDCCVGLVEGTEQYADMMRRHEIRMRAAEVNLKSSEAELTSSKASRLAKESDVFLIAFIASSSRSGIFHLSELPPKSSEWIILHDRSEKGTYQVSENNKVLTVEWIEDQDWLSSARTDEFILINTESKHIVRSLG